MNSGSPAVLVQSVVKVIIAALAVRMIIGSFL